MKNITLIVLLCLPLIGFGQKLKYKDIYPLVESRQWDEAEVLLKEFLKEDKNADEGNAWYQLGVILETKFNQVNFLNDTVSLFAFGDSATTFFRNAIQNINEKELKRNDQYYQPFYRRDLRTGQFGIKLSDVHLDIEKKIEDIETKIRNTKAFYLAMNDLSSEEKKLVESFNTLAGKYESLADFVMRAGANETKLLGEFKTRIDQFKTKCEKVFKLATDLGVSDKYNKIAYRRISSGFQSIEPLIEPLLDYKSGKLESWDFDRFVEDAKLEISVDVNYLKKELETLDQVLVYARAAIVSGEKGKFLPEIPEQVTSMADRYHPKSVPLSLAKAYTSENIVLSLSNPKLTPMLKDSSNVLGNLQITDSILVELDKVKKHLEGLAGKVKKEEAYYANFYYERYKGADNVVNVIKEKQQWADDMTKTWQANQLFWDIKANFGVTPSSVVALYPAKNKDGNDYLTVNSWQLDENQVLVAGFRKSDNSAFLSLFGSDRMVVFETFIKHGMAKELTWQSLVSDTVIVTEGYYVAYLFNPNADASANLLVFQVSNEGKVMWNTTVAAINAPKSSLYDQLIGQTTLFYFEQSAYPIDGDEPGYLILDNKGAIR